MSALEEAQEDAEAIYLHRSLIKSKKEKKECKQCYYGGKFYCSYEEYDRPKMVDANPNDNCVAWVSGYEERRKVDIENEVERGKKNYMEIIGPMQLGGITLMVMSPSLANVAIIQGIIVASWCFGCFIIRKCAEKNYD